MAEPSFCLSHTPPVFLSAFPTLIFLIHVFAPLLFSFCFTHLYITHDMNFLSHPACSCLSLVIQFISICIYHFLSISDINVEAPNMAGPSSPRISTLFLSIYIWTHTDTHTHQVQALISFSASVSISTGCKRLGNKVKQCSFFLTSLLFPHSLPHSSLFIP